MKRCFNPVLEVTDCSARIKLQLPPCGCNPDITALVIVQGGCVEYENKVEYKACEPRGFGCCGVPVCTPQPYITSVEKPKLTLTYPLHETDCEGWAVFVLDNKFKQLGYGAHMGHLMIGETCVGKVNILYNSGFNGVMESDVDMARHSGGC